MLCMSVGHFCLMSRIKYIEYVIVMNMSYLVHSSTHKYLH